MFPDMYPPHCNVAEYRHRDDRPPPMAVPAQFPNALGFMAEETIPQHTSLTSTPSMLTHASLLLNSHIVQISSYQLPYQYIHIPSHLGKFPGSYKFMYS